MFHSLNKSVKFNQNINIHEINFSRMGARIRMLEDTVLTFIIQQQLNNKFNSTVTRFDCTGKRLIVTRIKREAELVRKETVRHL